MTSRIHRALIAALVTIYLAAGIAGFFIDFDSPASRALWIVFLLGGALLIVVGAVVRSTPEKLSSGLVSTGAIAGAVPLFWTILVPLAAAVLIGMTFSLSRRQPAEEPPGTN